VQAYGQRESWEALIDKADRAFAQKRFADAEQNYRRALELARKFENKDPRIAVSLVKLADLCSSQSRVDEAEALADQSITALHKAGENAKSTGGASGLEEDYYRAETSALILRKAAAIFLTDRQFSKAEQAYKRVIEIREKAAQAPEQYRRNEDFVRSLGQILTSAKAKVADAYADLARAYFVQGKFAEAAVVYSKSVDILKVELGEDEPPVASALTNLATAYAAQSLYQKAEPLFRQALDIFQRSNWLDKPEAATTFENYSLLLRKTGREEQAAVMMEKGNQIRAKLDHPQP
jgi:tetratricopeptide (TPR) repeat protein